MNIIDILRGLPFPVQAGILQLTGMTDQRAQPAAAPEAGAGRGFVNPPVVNPAAPRPVAAPAVAAPVTPPPIVAAMAPTAPASVSDNIDAGGGQNIAMAGPDRTPDNIDAGGGQNIAMQGPAAQPGILSRMGFADGNQAMMALGGALAAAGSADPAKTALQIAAQQTEDMKTREAVRRAGQPKFTPLQNGAFVMAEVPGMAPQILPVSQVQNFMRETEKMKTMNETERAVFLEQLKNRLKTESEVAKEARAGEGDRVQAGLNVQQLNQIADSLEKTDTATGPVIGLFPKWARDVVTPEGASLQDAAERIIQGGLRATLGGQFTKEEGDRFLARAYNPRLDEKQNAANLRTIAREIAAMQLDKKNALEYFQKNGTLEGFTPNVNAGSAPAASPASPPPSDALRSAVTAAGIAFEPDKYQYRIGPNGQVQRKAK